MTIHVHATYRAGLIHPDRPLNLPDNTEVNLTVVPITSGTAEPVRPPAPRVSPEELLRRLGQHAVRAASLPREFSRADIYPHDE